MCALHHMPRIMFDLLQLLIAIGVGIVITGLCACVSRHLSLQLISSDGTDREVIQNRG